jgi:hypothetical protein
VAVAAREQALGEQERAQDEVRVYDVLAELDRAHVPVDAAIFLLASTCRLRIRQAERALARHPDWKPLISYLDRTSERRLNRYTRLRLLALGSPSRRLLRLEHANGEL